MNIKDHKANDGSNSDPNNVDVKIFHNNFTDIKTKL